MGASPSCKAEPEGEKMRLLRLSALAAGLPLFVAWIPAAHALGTIFSYQVDSFEVVGNDQGTRVDEFDDDQVSPWNNYYFGTAVETGGSLFLESPGYTDYAMTQLYPGLILDRSDVFSPSSFNVFDEGGDFVATSVWSADPLDTNGYQQMTVGFHPNGGTEKVGASVTFANFDAEVAALLGVPSGPAIGQAQWVSTGEWILSFEPVGKSLDELELELTGALNLRLTFDDTANTITTSFSLDGGESFVSPFAPIDFPLEGAGLFTLSGDPMRLVPEPTTFFLLATGLAGLAAAGRRRSHH